jgi:hypothetical protein
MGGEYQPKNNMKSDLFTQELSKFFIAAIA